MEPKKAPPPAVRTESIQSQKFRIKVLAVADAIIQARAKSGVYGEVTVKFSTQNGELTGAKILEETNFKPGD